MVWKGNNTMQKLETLSLEELRIEWKKHWKIKPHKGIGRTMLERSLEYKINNHLTDEQNERLNMLIKQYKRNPTCFDRGNNVLKPGTRLVREWQGKRHCVTVKSNGFDYLDRHYTSLSQIANDITGTRWNGHVFFGLK